MDGLLLMVAVVAILPFTKSDHISALSSKNQIMCPEYASLHNGKCYCNTKTMTFVFPNGQLHCLPCLQCPKCLGSDYECDNFKAYKFVESPNCTYPKYGYYVKHGVFEKCQRSCSDHVNEVETQPCGCDHDRKCECDDKYYRNSDGSCTLLCSPCPVGFSFKDRVRDGCTLMPYEHRCTQPHPDKQRQKTVTPMQHSAIKPSLTIVETSLKATYSTAKIQNLQSISTEAYVGNINASTTKITLRETSTHAHPPRDRPENTFQNHQFFIASLTILFVVLLIVVVCIIWYCYKRRNRQVNIVRYEENGETTTFLRASDENIGTTLEDLKLHELPARVLATKIGKWFQSWEDGILMLFKDPEVTNKVNRPLLNKVTKKIYAKKTHIFSEKEFILERASLQTVFSNIKSDIPGLTIAKLFEVLHQSNTNWELLVGLKNHLLKCDNNNR